MKQLKYIKHHSQHIQSVVNPNHRKLYSKTNQNLLVDSEQQQKLQNKWDDYEDTQSVVIEDIHYEIIVTQRNKEIVGQFSSKQKDYLYDYYKNFCVQHSYTNGSTFDQYSMTINLCHWMRFCQKANLTIKNTDFHYNIRQIPKQNQFSVQNLKNIFQKQQNKNNKMNFQNYCNAISDIIKAIDKNNQSSGFSSIPIDPYKFLGLRNQINHNLMLERLGIISTIKQRVSFSDCNSINSPKLITALSKSSLVNQSKLNQSQSSNKNRKQHLFRQKFPKILQNPRIDLPSNTEKQHSFRNSITTKRSHKKQIRTFRSRQQHKKLELLKKLNINNLIKIFPQKNILCNLQQKNLLSDDVEVKKCLNEGSIKKNYKEITNRKNQKMR